jgi:hypothetical protein
MLRTPVCFHILSSSLSFNFLCLLSLFSIYLDGCTSLYHTVVTVGVFLFRENVQHFSFVLTNLEAKWTFGFCRLAPNCETALVFLSYLPWHELFYKMLNLCAELTQSSNSGQFFFVLLANVILCILRSTKSAASDIIDFIVIVK